MNIVPNDLNALKTALDAEDAARTADGYLRQVSPGTTWTESMSAAHQAVVNEVVLRARELVAKADAEE